MAYVAADKRTLEHYQMDVIDGSKLGIGFHEKQGILAHIAVVALRTLESPRAMLSLLRCKDYTNANFFKLTDTARAGLDRHVVRKRNSAAAAAFSR